MANIKTRLIHLLGGVTKKESDSELATRIIALNKGKELAMHEMLDVMNEAYGNPKWGNIVYNYVKQSLEEISKA